MYIFLYYENKPLAGTNQLQHAAQIFDEAVAKIVCDILGDIPSIQNDGKSREELAGGIGAFEAVHLGYTAQFRWVDVIKAIRSVTPELSLSQGKAMMEAFKELKIRYTEAPPDDASKMAQLFLTK